MNVQENIERAKELIKSNKTEESIELLEKLKEITSFDFDVYFELGKAYYILGNNKKAFDNLRVSCDIQRDNIYSKTLLAKCLRNLGRDREALRVLRNFEGTETEKEIKIEIVRLLIKVKRYKAVYGYIIKKFDKSEYNKYFEDIKKLLLDLANIGRNREALRVLRNFEGTEAEKEIRIEIVRLLIKVKRYKAVYGYIIKKFDKSEYNKYFEDIKKIAFELKESGEIYSILEKKEDGMSYLEKRISSVEHRYFIEALLLVVYNKLNCYDIVFSIYEIIKKENRTIEDINSILENCSNYKVDKIKQFYDSMVYYYKKILEEEKDFKIKLENYKVLLKILRSEREILLKYKILDRVQNPIYDILKKCLKYQNSINDISKVQEIYKTLSPLIHKDEKKIRNFLFNEYEISKRFIKLRSFPRVIEFCLTNKCNFRCIMCDGRNNDGTFSISDKRVKDLMELMPYLERLILRGGEVFLDNRLNEILESAKNNNVPVEVITNGSLFTKENIDMLLDINTSIIVISIDSLIKERYEKIRIGGNFKKLLENIELLNNRRKEKKSNVFIGINMVVMSFNYDEIEDIIEFAGKNQFHNVQLLHAIMIEQERQKYKLNKDMIKILSDKKEKFLNIAKKYNITLINKLQDEYVDKQESVDKKEYANDNINHKQDKKLNDVIKYNDKEKEINNLQDEYVDKQESVDKKEYANDNINHKQDKKLNDVIKYNDKEKEINNLQPYEEKLFDFDSNKVVGPLKSIFCFRPFNRIEVDNYQILPSCLCKKVEEIPSYKKNIYKNSILNDWNNQVFKKYRSYMILNKQEEICSNDCLINPNIK